MHLVQPSPRREDVWHQGPRIRNLTGQLFNISQYAIAFGGYADVWECDWIKNDTVIKVAAKAIRRRSSSDSDISKTLKQYKRELDVWCGLRHECVLPLYGIADEFLPGISVMVCPWLEHGTVTRFIASHGDLAERHRLHLIGDVAAGLRYLHSKSIVHGDLSGSNILVCAQGRAYVADFGLSVLLTEYDAASCIITGAARWAAPELIGLPAGISNLLSPQSDMYSFGSIVFHILSGEIPYDKKWPDFRVAGAVVRGMKPPRPQVPQISDRHWDFIQRCWLPLERRSHRPSADDACNFFQYKHQPRRFAAVALTPVTKFARRRQAASIRYESAGYIVDTMLSWKFT